jgi:hypothetical protein
MVAAATVRASGQTTAEEVAPEAIGEIDRPIELPEEKPLNLTRAFQRMRTDWNSRDREIIQSVKSVVDQRILEDFRDAYALMFEIHNTVRLPVVDKENGEVKKDDWGLPLWQTNRDGTFVEDWDLIKRKERERFLHIIITRMFEWEQTAADIWGEAIFAKAQLEEAFATGFDSIADPKATVDARTARANKLSADHRYLAVYKSYYSRKADAIVRSMQGLSQRFKDLHVN